MPINVLAQPASAFIKGRQQRQQDDLLQEQAGRVRRQEQRQVQTDLLGNEITREKIKQLQEAGDFEDRQRKAKKDAGILNAVLQLPESQQQAGFEAAANRLEPEIAQMFGDPQTGGLTFNPQRATLLRNLAVEVNKVNPTTLQQNLQFAFPEDVEKQREIAGKKLTGEKTPATRKVQSSQILPGGITRLVYDNGDIETKESDAAKKELIKSAEVRGAELQGLRSGEREEAKNSSKRAIEAFKGLEGIKKSVRLLDEGIKLLDEGAETGPIVSRFPSVREASIKLDNLQARLGLDVIGNTTFGALSEGELNLALQVATPTTLKPDALKKWMQDKRDAQVKLADYLTEAALFLGTPGNTIADFLRQKQETQAPETPQDLSTMSIEQLMQLREQAQ